MSVLDWSTAETDFLSWFGTQIWCACVRWRSHHRSSADVRRQWRSNDILMITRSTTFMGEYSYSHCKTTTRESIHLVPQILASDTKFQLERMVRVILAYIRDGATCSFLSMCTCLMYFCGTWLVLLCAIDALNFFIFKCWLDVDAMGRHTIVV